MKILVTGGAGFIGSHITDVYIKEGHRVVVLDSLLTGKRRNLNKKAKFYKADIRDLKTLEKILSKEQPEVVSHHAAIAEVMKSLKDPVPTLETNVIGTANLALSFGSIVRSKNKKMIFASTGGAIYGDPRSLPASEMVDLKPLSAYGLSKLLGEEILKFYARQFKFKLTIFRYANVFGPRQNPKGEAGVVAIFGGLIKDGKRPTIFGNGKKTRDYIYVSDIAKANILALKKGDGETFNLGRGEEVSDLDIYKAVAAAADFRNKPLFAKHRSGEVLRISLDASRAKKILGWRPSVKFEDGIMSTFDSI